MDNSICKKCGKPIAGRIDKRFCDSYCRNAFNNVVKRKDEKLISEINMRVRKNRRILRTLCPVGKATVRREVLEAIGYNFRNFSSIYRSPQGLIYYVNYDYAFSPIREDDGVEKVLIVQTQPYFYEPYDPWKYLKG